MSRYRARGRTLVVLAMLALLTGCTSGAGSKAGSSPTGAPSSPPTSPGPSTSASASAALVSPSPAVVETDDITYGGTDALTQPEQLDVYAPSRPGPWPVIVMFHGGPATNTKTTLGSLARHVAEEGFVVFVPSWGHSPGASGALPSTLIAANGSEAACAVAFAGTHAADYGGDPAKIIVFGHSAGAELAARVPFTRPTPTPRCLGGTTVGPISALVTWDGDWTLMDYMWDEVLPSDPAAMIETPITQIGSDKAMRVVMLMSGIVEPYIRDLSDPKVFEAFFKARDPTGAIRAQLEAIGALDDNAYDIQEAQRLLYTLLKAQGNPVSLTALPGASHDTVDYAPGTPAMTTFLAAFREAAA